MKLHTDKLTAEDLSAALPGGVELHDFSVHGSRSRNRAFNLYLSGSGRMYGQWGTGNHRSATWTEYGVWMSRLFEIDPRAKIGPHDGRGEFVEMTSEEVNRRVRYGGFGRRKAETDEQYARRLAPWLYPSLDVDKVLAAYVTCALWSSLDTSIEDDSGNNPPMDDNYGPDDMAPEALDSMRADIVSILEQCAEEALPLEDLNRSGASTVMDYSADDMFGHDFWLTRNGHGAGFWDRGLGKLGDRLTEMAQAFGSSDLYVMGESVHVS